FSQRLYNHELRENLVRTLCRTRRAHARHGVPLPPRLSALQIEDMSSLARLNRLFAPDGKCFDLAIDHGAFNEHDFLSGIEDMGKTVAAAIEAAPDAIQLSVGQAHFLQEVRGRQKPSLVLRVDTANVY